ncbi:hypothetical protein [Corynebacterium oculi]|uniref:hypothetical protein n=1 Tax=Corynebacterium oculi TaxID=1544416 RepID=UPI0012371D25|nr:hypothetical protein [Corynebacterium oculi]
MALAAWYGGRIAAAIAWQGEYLPRLNMVADLRVPECVPVEDFFAPRVACSPHYLWFQFAGAFAAMMLAAAGVHVIRQRRALSGAVTMGVGLIAAGFLSTMALTAEPSRYPGLHYALEAAAVASMWFVMASAAVTARRQRAMVDEAQRATAALNGPLLPVTWVLLGVSVLGALLTVAAAFGTGYDNPVGLYQRMAIDAPALWLLAVASGWWRR